MPNKWYKIGNDTVSMDSMQVSSGKYSTLIKSNSEGESFGSILNIIGASPKGQEVRLEGYMKLENVENGNADLFLSISRHGSTLAYSDLKKENVHGTKDWTKYSVSAKLPKRTSQIHVGGGLSGTGSVWFDNFNIYIDGKNISTIKEEKPIQASFETNDKFKNSSGIELKNPDQSEITRLYKICKVWGLLKYNHPDVAKGKFDWDYELFKILPIIDAENFEGKLLDWINSIGNPGPETTRDDYDYGEVKLRSNLDWISNKSLFTEKITQKLDQIKNSAIDGQHFYVGFDPYVGNPIFTNESSYSVFDWNDSGIKLLALFRYWNIINYFFPYRNLIDENWDSVLKRFIPKILNTDDEQSYKITLIELFSKVGDSHISNSINEQGFNDFLGSKILPIEIEFVENKALIADLLGIDKDSSKIREGDVVTSVDNVEIMKLVEQRKKYYPSSNISVQLADMSKDILRTDADKLLLTYENKTGSHSEYLKTIDVSEIAFENHIIPSSMEFGGDIGYINAAQLRKGEIHNLMKSFTEKKGIIVDLRGYPSDAITYPLSDYLMPEPTPFARTTSGNIKPLGEFTFGKEILSVGKTNVNYYKGKVAVLVDHNTISNSEFTAMALRVAPNAKVIGSQTAGADGNVSALVLPGNVRTRFSGIGVYYPDGGETQRKGIIPDIMVNPSILGTIEGKDEILDEALIFIRQPN